MARRSAASYQLSLAVLAYLMEKPRHPYELGKVVRERNGQESIDYKHASLYMVIDQLRRDGHIEAFETVRDGQRPERTVYRLTDSGRAELRDRMRTQIATPAKEHRMFEGVLSLVAALAPEEVDELLTERATALAAQIARIHEHVDDDPSIHRLFHIEHEYRLGQLEAEATFVREFQQLIRDNTENFTTFWTDLRTRVLTAQSEPPS